MRFIKPKHGQKRIIRKFLLLPQSVGYETRWLEHAIILQTFVETLCYAFWKNTKFLTKEEAAEIAKQLQNGDNHG